MLRESIKRKSSPVVAGRARSSISAATTATGTATVVSSANSVFTAGGTKDIDIFDSPMGRIC